MKIELFIRESERKYEFETLDTKATFCDRLHISE
jgi:hypothetical protein